jgi:hypothetical protein
MLGFVNYFLDDVCLMGLQIGWFNLKDKNNALLFID